MSNFAALFVIFQNRNILAFAENQCYNSVILLGNLHRDLQIFLHYVYYAYKINFRLLISLSCSEPFDSR